MATRFRDYVVGRIPDGWAVYRIGELLSEDFSGTWGSENANGVKVLRSTNFQNNGYLNLGSVAVREIPENFLSNKAINIGDILLERSGGGPQQPVGRVSWCDDRVTGWTFSNFCQILRPSARMDSKFLFYALYYLHMSSITLTYQNQTTGIRNLEYKSYLRISIPLPPLPEQRKIADILSTVDETIEKTDAIIRETQQFKKGLMQKLFTEGIGHTRFKETKIGRIPEEWEIARLGKYCRVQGGPAFKSSDYVEKGVPLVRISNIRDESVDCRGSPHLQVDYVERYPEFVLTKGDILIAMSGATTGKVGAYNNEEPALLNQRVGRYIVINENKILQKFLRFLVDLPSYRNKALVDANGAAQPNVSPSRLEHVIIAIPTLAEQYKISEILSEVDLKIDKEQTFKEELERLKKGLMQVLLTGEVRVKA